MGYKAGQDEAAELLTSAKTNALENGTEPGIGVDCFSCEGPLKGLERNEVPRGGGDGGVGSG